MNTIDKSIARLQREINELEQDIYHVKNDVSYVTLSHAISERKMMIGQLKDRRDEETIGDPYEPTPASDLELKHGGGQYR
jgi:hypothetical protein